MGTRETYRGTLIRACMLAGGEAKLARKLHMPVPVLHRHLFGEVPIPNHLFLKAVDLVLAAEASKAGRASPAKSAPRTARTR